MPEDIETQVFKERFGRGYDPEDVDRFLDRVTDRMVELINERDAQTDRAVEAESRLRSLQDRADESSQAEVLLKRTLVTAQRTAEEIVAEARAKAAQSLADAQSEADELRESSEAEADETLTAARNEAAALLTDAGRRASELLAEARWRSDRVRVAVDELQRFRNDYRERVRGVIAEQLALLDRAGEIPEVSPTLEALVSSSRESAGEPLPAIQPKAAAPPDAASQPDVPTEPHAAHPDTVSQPVRRERPAEHALTPRVRRREREPR